MSRIKEIGLLRICQVDKLLSQIANFVLKPLNKCTIETIAGSLDSLDNALDPLALKLLLGAHKPGQHLLDLALQPHLQLLDHLIGLVQLIAGSVLKFLVDGIEGVLNLLELVVGALGDLLDDRGTVEERLDLAGGLGVDVRADEQGCVDYDQ
jgi:hypothetical protein